MVSKRHEGNINDKFKSFFNQDNIREVVYMGYKDKEEARFQSTILNKESAENV